MAALPAPATRTLPPVATVRLLGRDIAVHEICPATLRTVTHRGICRVVAYRRDARRTLCLALGLTSGRQTNPRWHYLRPTTLVFTGFSGALLSAGEAASTYRSLPHVYPNQENGCLNLYGSPESVRFHVEQHNCNPHFNAYALIIAVQFEEFSNIITERLEYPVFPEVPTGHALVKRLRGEAPLTPIPFPVPVARASA